MKSRDLLQEFGKLEFHELGSSDPFRFMLHPALAFCSCVIRLKRLFSFAKSSAGLPSSATLPSERTTIILWNVIVIDHHDVADHLSFGVNPEGLALIPVNVGLGKAPDRMRDKALLTVRQFQIEGVNKVVFSNWS